MSVSIAMDGPPPLGIKIRPPTPCWTVLATILREN